MKHFAPAIFLMLVMLSCAKEVSVKTSTEPRQVLSAFFSDLTDTLTLYLSNMEALSGNESKGLTNAEVSLFENGVKVLDFESKGNGFYQAAKGSFTFKVGAEYELTSKVDGLPDISAKAIFTPEVPFDSMAYKKLSDERSAIDLWFHDPPDTANFYGFFMGKYSIDSTIYYVHQKQNFLVQGVDYYDKIVSDDLFDGQAVTVQMIFDERLDSSIKDKLGTPGTKVSAIMLNTEQIWYEFEKEIQYNSADPDEIFGYVLTKNLPTNVKGGYGIFGLGNASIIEIIF